MQIITLTTDMGTRDHYVASLKATILAKMPNVQIIDISHSVRPFDISEAAYHVRSCFNDFPKGTVHIIGVDSEPIINFGGADGSFPSVLEESGQYFIANDNGFFGAFLEDKKPEKLWRVDNILSVDNPFRFPAKNLLVPIAEKIVSGISLKSFAEPAIKFKRAFSQAAVSEPNLIKGHIIHFDTYGNVITNISEELFRRMGEKVPFTIYFKNKNYFIDAISESYNEVAQGEKVAIFNDNRLLEIAINRGANNSTGGAQELFGLRINDIIRVEFTPQGSRQTLESLF